MNTYNEKEMERAIALLKKKPRNVEQLAKKFNKSPKTIKRWLEEMRIRGHRVVREGVNVASPYCIVENPTLPQA